MAAQQRTRSICWLRQGCFLSFLHPLRTPTTSEKPAEAGLRICLSQMGKHGPAGEKLTFFPHVASTSLCPHSRAHAPFSPEVTWASLPPGRLPSLTLLTGKGPLWPWAALWKSMVSLPFCMTLVNQRLGVTS